MTAFKVGSKISVDDSDFFTVQALWKEDPFSYFYLGTYEDKKTILVFPKKYLPVDEAYENNIKEITSTISPRENFLWPFKKVYFGCLIEYPEGFIPLSEYLKIRRDRQLSKVDVLICLNLAREMTYLHKNGYFYNKITPDDIYVDVEGEVRLGGLEYASKKAFKINSFLLDKLYQPPYHLNFDRDIYSDRYFLSLVIYMLIMNGHPLEGIDFANQEKNKSMIIPLEKDPFFCFDPLYRSLRGEKYGTPYSNRWDRLPLFLQEMFIDAFSRRSILNPMKRLSEMEWIDGMMRLLGSTEFDEIDPPKFWEAIYRDLLFKGISKSSTSKEMIILARYSLPLQEMVIYRYQLEKCSIEKAFDKIAEIRKGRIGHLPLHYLYNLTDQPFELIVNEEAFTIEPQDSELLDRHEEADIFIPGDLYIGYENTKAPGMEPLLIKDMAPEKMALTDIVLLIDTSKMNKDKQEFISMKAKISYAALLDYWNSHKNFHFHLRVVEVNKDIKGFYRVIPEHDLQYTNINDKITFEKELKFKDALMEVDKRLALLPDLTPPMWRKPPIIIALLSSAPKEESLNPYLRSLEAKYPSAKSFLRIYSPEVSNEDDRLVEYRKIGNQHLEYIESIEKLLAEHDDSDPTPLEKKEG
ncbi:MAG: hypothetical protein K5694_00425 [Bacilli bacterium]|nr:hypothetical protein [Bacilli bacterium]